MTAPVVADASPVIALHQIGQLRLLPGIFTAVIVPPAVAREIQPRVPSVPWILERPLEQAIAPLVLRASLEAGESEASSLAIEVHADRLLRSTKVRWTWTNGWSTTFSTRHERFAGASWLRSPPAAVTVACVPRRDSRAPTTAPPNAV